MVLGSLVLMGGEGHLHEDRNKACIAPVKRECDVLEWAPCNRYDLENEEGRSSIARFTAALMSLKAMSVSRDGML